MFNPQVSLTNSNQHKIANGQQSLSISKPFQGRTVRKRTDDISSRSVWKTMLVLGALLSPASAGPMKLSGLGNSEALSKSCTQLSPVELPFDVKPICQMDPFPLSQTNETAVDMLSKPRDAQANKQIDTELVTHIMAAIHTRNYDKMIRLNLKDKNIDLNYPLDAKGRSFLHLAVEHNFMGGIRALIEAGADPNHGDRLGLTPLHHAVIRKRPNIIEILGKLGADPNKVCFNGYTPINFVLWVYILEEKAVLKSLLNIPGAEMEIVPKSPLKTTKGYQKFHDNIINYVTSSSVERTAEDPSGLRERLIEAIQAKEYDKMFTWNFDEIDLNYPLDVHGRSFLHFALALEPTAERDQLISKLLKEGAMLSYGDNYGLTPLHYATARLDLNAVLRFICSGASPDQFCLHGFSARDFSELMGSPFIFGDHQIFCESNEHIQDVRQKIFNVESAKKKILQDDERSIFIEQASYLLKIKKDIEVLNGLMEYMISSSTERIVSRDLTTDQCFQYIPRPTSSSKPFDPHWKWPHMRVS